MDREQFAQAIEKQAEFVNGLTFTDLKLHTIEQAKLVLLDSVGCMALGNRQYHLMDLPQGNVTLVGIGKTDKTDAVFWNGASMVKNELDEGNQFAAGHPACHIVPALLAETEQLSVTGRDVITALVAAYEVSCRWGCGVRIKPSMHVHGTMQTVGAAAVSCKLNGCSAEETREAYVLAGSLPQAACWASAFEGDQLRNAYIGISNNIGMQAFRMVRSGVRSSIPTLTSVWENVADGSINPELLIKEIGQEFYLDRNYFKIHSACRYTHSFADSVRNFMAQGMEWQDIERVEIETYAAASKLNGTTARNAFAMRFSIPVSLAVCMIYGDLSVANVTDEHVADKRVRGLATRVSVKENPEYTAALPNVRKNRIEVYTRSGKVYCQESSVTKGDYQDPFSAGDIVRKFCKQTENIWSPKHQERLIDFLMSLEKQVSMADLYALIGAEELQA